MFVTRVFSISVKIIPPLNISGTVKGSELTFSGLVDTMNVFNWKFSKFEVVPKFGP